MSEHLSSHGIARIVLERSRIAERWRVERWSSLVATGPAWHDRFPSKEFADCDPDDFPTKANVVSYFEEFVDEMDVPIRCGVTVAKSHQSSWWQRF
jgi:putative flavoprotein involved in K+ transport